MLVVETIARIRREHLSRGKSIKEIARDLKISRNTVRKILRSGETSFSYEREIQPRPKLGRWKADIDRDSVRIEGGDFRSLHDHRPTRALALESNGVAVLL